MLQRAGLRDSSFIAMSNYYYDEKSAYLTALAAARKNNHDLTPFLLFGLRGIALQCQRLMSEIQYEISKELYRNLMYDLFLRLKTQRKRVIAERQIEVLKTLLDVDSVLWTDLISKMERAYSELKNPVRALVRDVNYLRELGAISVKKIEESVAAANEPPLPPRIMIAVRLTWPAEITETEFFEKVRRMPKAKTHAFLA